MKYICVTMDPGICGFMCVIKVWKKEKQKAVIEISGSECKQVQRLSETLNELTLQELFMPLTRNPVFICAEKAGCHPACPMPVAVIKAVEAAMGMALPRNVRINFEQE